MNAKPFIIVTITIALLIALVVSLQTIRKALENPVKNLRAE